MSENEKTPCFDFPTWLPPMLVKELRQGLRTRGFVLSLIGLHTALVIAFVWALVVQLFDRSTGLGIVNGFFWTFALVALIFVMPLRALSGLRSEIDARNIDLLMLTQLTSWRVVWGKWSSLAAQSALLLVTLLPYCVMRYFFGGVDLLADFLLIAEMFLISCTVTALMLWVSGWNRLLRVLLVIAAILLLNALLGSSVFGLFRYGFGSTRAGLFSGGPSTTFAPYELCLDYNMVVLLVFFLLQAVRRIAPPSENHSLATRLLALAPLLPMPLLLVFRDAGGMATAINVQSVFALVAFMLVCVLELATCELPMPVQVRQLYGRGARWRRIACALFLPGWAGAALFTLVGLGFFGALVCVDGFPDPFSRLKFLRVLGLVWVAVVLPAAVVSLFVKRGKIAAMILYGVLQSGAVLLCVSGSYIIHTVRRAGESNVKELIEGVYRVLPVTSYWFELFKMDRRGDIGGPLLIGGQIAMCALAVVFIAFCARPFFRAYKAGVRSIKTE